MRYVPALDGLRAIAVITVLLFHARVPYLQGGYLGVDVFFVLSGFLITGILLAEMESTGGINLWRFYKNRALRLVPPLLILLSLYLLIAPFAWPDYDYHLRDALLAAAYLSDYSKALFNAPDMLRHTWSLSIEEHFYLAWPLLILLIRRQSPGAIVGVLFALYGVATAWRFLAVGENSWPMAYPRFDTRLSGLVFGSFLAAGIRMVNMNKIRTSVLMAIGLLVAAIFTYQWRSPDSLKYGVTAAEWATALALVAIMRNTGRQHWLALPVLTYIGRLSYGLYLFHFPIMLYLRGQFHWSTTLIVGGVGAFILAAISYHTVEAWVRRMRTVTPVQTSVVCAP